MAAAKKPSQKKKRRSDIFRYMWDHYELCEVQWPGRTRSGKRKNKGGANWKELALEFARQGFTDGDGKPPTEKAVAATWYDVRREWGQKVKRQSMKPKKTARSDFHRTAR